MRGGAFSLWCVSCLRSCRSGNCRLLIIVCCAFKHAAFVHASRRPSERLSMNQSGDNLRRLVGLYRTMARIRAFEETAVAAHKAGEIPGPMHVSIGQEAVA